jgi:beta-ureidopropionase
MAGDDDGTLAGHDRLEDLLAAHLPPRELDAAMRVLYGGAAPELELPAACRALATGDDDDSAAATSNGNGHPSTTTTTTKPFDLRCYSLASNAAREQGRAPRVVRVGVIQHATPLPTTAPYGAQRDAAFARVSRLAEAAGLGGCNVLCLQEAWTMPFAFCTREREWCEFAESAEEGPATRLCQKLARRFNMVVLSPILERDAAHGDTIWNTVVVIGPGGQVIGKHRKVRRQEGGKAPLCPRPAHEREKTTNQQIASPPPPRKKPQTEPHPPRRRLQRVDLLLGGRHRAPCL